MLALNGLPNSIQNPEQPPRLRRTQKSLHRCGFPPLPGLRAQEKSTFALRALLSIAVAALPPRDDENRRQAASGHIVAESALPGRKRWAPSAAPGTPNARSIPFRRTGGQASP